MDGDFDERIGIGAAVDDRGWARRTAPSGCARDDADRRSRRRSGDRNEAFGGGGHHAVAGAGEQMRAEPRDHRADRRSPVARARRASGVPAPNTPTIGSFRSIRTSARPEIYHRRSLPGDGRGCGLAPEAAVAFRADDPDVTFLAALLARAGELSVSPCVLPLVPPYLVYLAGTSLERLADAEPEPRVRRETVVAALLFVCGFSTVFVALGASASVDRRAAPRLFG